MATRFGRCRCNALVRRLPRLKRPHRRSRCRCSHQHPLWQYQQDRQYQQYQQHRQS